MCGQAAVVGTIHVPGERAFKKLLIYNSTRGEDSTGAGSVKRAAKEGMVVAKEIGHPFELFNLKRKNEHDWSDVIGGFSKVLIGHCRSATRGSVFRRNAHPFLFDNVMGAHNGTLDYTSQNKLSANKRYDTDSEAIYAEIDTHGIQKTVPLLSGAYALVWYDIRDNTFNMIRNKERSLYYTFDELNEQLFVSSEWEHLASATKEIKREKDSIHLLPEDILFSWVVPETNGKFGEASRTKLSGFTIPPYKHTAWKGMAGQNTGTDDRMTHADAAYWDKQHGLYKKWNIVEGGYDYSRSISGPWKKLEELDSGFGYDDSETVVPKPHLSVVSNIPSDQLKKVREEVLASRFAKEIGDKAPKSACVYKDTDIKVYYNNDEKLYTVCRFTGPASDQGWKIEHTKLIPEEVPLTKLDVNARHEFSHQGKGKNKRIFYKGFNGNLLPEVKFLELMQQGCLTCNRKPEWSNKVVFINKTDFMCEHCSRNEEEVQQWKMAEMM